MAYRTAIQWCDSTENPTMGCDGCELWSATQQTCYAGVLHRRFAGVSSGYANDFTHPETFPGRMERASRWSCLRGVDRPDKPWLSGRPRMIFVSDMSDSLSQSISFEYLREQIFDVVSGPKGSRHDWLWLTKRPKRMAEFSRWLNRPWPNNLWVGTSLTDHRSLRRREHLLDVGDESTIRFLSVEPQLECLASKLNLSGIAWVIQGGESGPKARPFQLDWAKRLIDHCRKNSTAYFLKQLGSHVQNSTGKLRFNHNHAGDWSEWPEDIRVRELPKC